MPDTAEPPRDAPLAGVTIVVTRPRPLGDVLARALRERGARALCVPTIAIADPEDFAPLDRALDEIESYDWVVFTSRNGVERFVERLRARRGAAALPARLHVAAVGPATSAALAARGLAPDVVPDEYVAEGLFAAISASTPLAGARVLLARAAVARDVLPDALRAAGAHVDIAEVYRTDVAEESRPALVELVDGGGIDVAVFTSSSTAASFVELVGRDAARAVRAVCTGPIVARTARELGLEVAAELPAYSLDGVVDAVERFVAAR
jgi:uroporphyrinogen III methyltransferase/synthase